VINKLSRNEIHIDKHKTHYEIKINPIRKESAGVYTCEDDVSLINKNGHSSNITLHVIGIIL
jgi:hypothetical protein